MKPFVFIVVALLAAACPGQELQVPPAPSAADIAAAPTFSADQRVVATHYFYWYKWPAEHFFDDPRTRRHDILRHHFPDATQVDYESKAWHRRQMEDLLAAGIDVALPVYWGTPNNYEKADLRFSVRGLPPLVAALDDIAAEGRTPPRVGLFFDTSTLLAGHAFRDKRRENADLRTEEGRDLFYRTIRDFFRIVPPRHWACLDEWPIVALYESAFAAGHDQSTIDYVYEQFQKDFAGRRPYVIAGPSWNFKADARTGWGAALNGPILGEHAAQVGPGYDDSPVPGRTTPTRDRLAGGFYAASWLLAIQHRPRIVIVETWSEMHEGTPICETLEDGRKYIELTRRFADRFKRREEPTAEEWAGALRSLLSARSSSAWGREFAGRLALGLRFDSAGKVVEEGLRLVRGVSDGVVGATEREGVACIETRAGDSRGRYIYFDIADPYYYDHSGELTLRIRYLDAGTGDILVQYDSSEPIGPLDGAYREGVKIPRNNTSEWWTVTVTLKKVRCANRQNGGADFRLESRGGELLVSEVLISKVPGHLEGD